MPSTNKTGRSSYLQPFQIGDDESVVDFQQRATWLDAMVEATQKHSEMMQPWKDVGDYPNMEYAYPDLNGPGDYNLPPSQRDIEILNPNSGVCVLSCYSPLYCDDDVECHFNISQAPPGMNPAEAPAHWQMEARETNPSTTPPLQEKLVSGDRLSIQSHQSELEMDKVYKAVNDIGQGKPPQVSPDKMERRTSTGARAALFPLRIAPPSGGWPAPPDNQRTMLYVRAMDAAGNVCDTKLSVFCRVQDCCERPGYVAMTFDDASTSDTIARLSNITVYVLNGCGPFTWSVSGTGFSFATAQTSARENTLSADGTACGPATVTISDSCGTSVNSIIRCTSGSWSDKYLCTSCPSGCYFADCGDRDAVCTLNVYEYLTDKKYREEYVGRNCYKANPCSIWKKSSTSCVDTCLFSPTKSVMANFSQTCTCTDGTGGQMCLYSDVVLQEWVC